jgi:membrane-bound lytic murein transglycosylase C
MNTLITRTLSIILLSGLLFQTLAQDDFEKWKQQQAQGLTELEAEQNQYLESVTREYDNYVLEQNRQFEDFKTEVEEKWREFKGSDAKRLVNYDPDLNSRSTIDFEKGEIEVEVIVEESPEKSASQKEEAAVEALEKKIQKVITQPAADKAPILADQVKDQTGKKISPAKAKTYANETVEKQKIHKTVEKAKDGKTRVKYTIKLKMVPDHVEVRAKRFKTEILKQSKRFDIDPAVAFAIMQTESSFNPEAKSHIPAYGLMQLVPKSGARDAYNYVYKKDKLLPGKYLYNPNNNIELGCAYISKLRHVYFRRIKNNRTAYYCTIAAYNTGAGNVARALTGTTKLRPTAEVANRKTPDQIYNTLLRKLPYKETQNYLKKVNERMSYYQEWTR